ncbi:hypothetical protein [Halolamina pelagica]|uniref:hypothetical protein n=1 Tax=Halolamina pelagica TaxID=699431 RepID=UPI0011873463|nr:hypothetical protein [Halolamina pelagica]
MVEKPNRQNISRRAAIKSGLTGLLFSTTGVVTGRSVSKTSVTSEIGGNGEKYKQDVPTRWWEYNLRTRKEMLNARDDFGGTNGIMSIGRSFTGDQLLGFKKPVLDFKIEPPAKSDAAPDTVGPSSLPSSYNGIPVKNPRRLR